MGGRFFKVAQIAALVIPFFAVAACSSTGRELTPILATIGNEAVTPAAFNVCYNHGCTKVVTVGLTPAQWNQVAVAFSPPPANAEEERARLRPAIALMERFVGEQTGTNRDIGGSFRGLGKGGQLDCIDETMNTGTYVMLFESTGLLRFHTLADQEYLGFFETGFWPHSGASIRERESGALFVVDSWWNDNGAPPYIVPYEVWWEGGWQKIYAARDEAADREGDSPTDGVAAAATQ